MQQKTVTKKLILDLVLALLILGACIVAGSYAWMTRNTSLKAENPDMQIFAPDIIVKDYTVYQYNAETNKVDDVTNAENHYVMTEYDTIFTERNVYTPLLFVVDLANVTKGAISVNVYCNADNVDTKAAVTSNVVCIKAATGNTINGYAESNNNVAISYADTQEARDYLFDSAAKYFKSINSQGQFCTITSGAVGIEKKTYISFDNLVLNSGDWVEEDDITVAKVFLIVDYDPALVAAQGAELFASGERSLANNDPIPYANDITTIYFESKK